MSDEPKKLTVEYLGDVILIQVIAAECGLPAIIDEAVRAKTLRRMQLDGIPARKIVDFVKRAIENGWLKFDMPLGYEEVQEETSEEEMLEVFP